MNCVAFVLAAGRSRRMQSSRSKVDLPLGGRRVLEYGLEVASFWAGHEVYVVASPTLSLPSEVHGVIQDPPLGTGHAFQVAFQAALARDPDLLKKDILVLLGDTPLVTKEGLRPLFDQRAAFPRAEMIVMAMDHPSPGAYGRVMHDGPHLKAIIEVKDAQEDLSSYSLCNTGVMLIQAAYAHRVLPLLSPSFSTGEYYLTDLVRWAEQATWVKGDWRDFVGLNTQEEWCEAERLLQNRFRQKAMAEGAFLMAPETTFLAYDTQVAADVMIHPFTTFGPGVRLGRETVIYSFSVLKDCWIHEGSKIGPFAHIRGKTQVGPQAALGAFVEVKNVTLGKNSQAKHLSYLGDTQIGEGVTIGAGVITCNYDGHQKHETFIGDHSFVGSLTALVAPVQIGEEVTVGAGSVITKSIPDQTLALSRSPQRAIPLTGQSKHLHRKKRG